jgi:hypothetical protein
MIITDLSYMQVASRTRIKGGNSCLSSWLQELETLFPSDTSWDSEFSQIVSSSSINGKSVTQTWTYTPESGWTYSSKSTP